MKRSARIIVTAALLLAVGLGGYVAGAGGLSSLTSSLAAQDDCATFQETGKRVCGRFLEYWRANGGLAQQGLPLAEEFDERSDVDGRTYKVQYFERAVFELHPENQPPFDVLLSLVGREKFAQKYPAGLPGGGVPLAVGQTFVAQSYSPMFKLTITNVVQSRSRPDAPQRIAKGKYVVVTFTALNIGKEPSYVSSLFTIRDQQGRRFSAEYSIGGSGIQPGLSDTVTFGFDVAPDAETFTIVPENRQ